MSEDTLNQRLLKQLEEITTSNRFVILDTSVLVYDPDSTHKQRFLGFLRQCEKQNDGLHKIPTDFAQGALDHFTKLEQIISKGTTFVTEQIFEETTYGITKSDAAITKMQKPAVTKDDSGRYTRLRDFRQANTQTTLAELQQKMQNVNALLQQKILTFKRPDVYNWLLAFFKHIAPYVKDADKTQGKNYRFGDESIAAATLYFTMTGHETPQQTTVITQDHDIKREIRTAYLLFSTANKSCFKTLAHRNPFKVYVLAGTPLEYVCKVDTQCPHQMPTAEQERHRVGGEERLRRMLKAARYVLNKIG